MGCCFGGRRLMSPPDYTVAHQGQTHLVIPSPLPSTPQPAVGLRQAGLGSCIPLGGHEARLLFQSLALLPGSSTYGPWNKPGSIKVV